MPKIITSKTKAIIAPHIYGQSCEMTKLKKICNKKKIRVGSIESAATGPAGKAFIYGINVDGEEVIIGFQSVRPKDGKGTRHQDTIEWAKDFQSRLQLASARMAQQESEEKPKKESIKYFGDILDELKQNTLGYHWMKAEEDYPVHYKQRKFKLDEYLINILT